MFVNVAYLLHVVGQPLQGWLVAEAPRNAAHEDLDRAQQRAARLAGRLDESQALAKRLLAHGLGEIDLVGKHDDRHRAQRLAGKDRVQLAAGLVEAARVRSIHDEDDGVGRHVVVAPDAARLLMPAEVVALQRGVEQLYLLLRHALRRQVRRHVVVAQHVQQRRFAGVVEAEQQDASGAAKQAKPSQQRPHPIQVPEPHLRG